MLSLTSRSCMAVESTAMVIAHTRLSINHSLPFSSNHNLSSWSAVHLNTFRSLWHIPFLGKNKCLVRHCRVRLRGVIGIRCLSKCVGSSISRNQPLDTWAWIINFADQGFKLLGAAFSVHFNLLHHCSSFLFFSTCNFWTMVLYILATLLSFVGRIQKSCAHLFLFRFYCFYQEFFSQSRRGRQIFALKIMVLK